MAAAFTNSLQALNGIYGALDRIVKDIERRNAAGRAKEQNENTVKQLNKGGLAGLSGAQQTVIETNLSAASSNAIRDISTALLSLPPAIKAVVGLGDAAIRSVVNTLTSIDAAFSELSNSDDAVKGSAALLNLANGLVKLQDVNFFSLILKFNTFDKVDIEKTLGKGFEKLVKSYQSLNKLTSKDFENLRDFTKSSEDLTKLVKSFSGLSVLMPLFNISVALFAPGMMLLGKIARSMPSRNRMQAAAEAIKAMTSFATSAAIMVATSLALGIALQQGNRRTILEGLGITLGVVTLLGGLALGISAVAGRTRGARRNLREVNHFINALALTTGLIFGLAMLYNVQKDAINSGLPVVGIVIGSLVGLAVLISVASRAMGLRNELNSISKFVGSLVLLTGAVLVLGTIAGQARPIIVAGLGIVLGVLGSIMAIALLTGVLMRFIHPVAMTSIMAFMGFSMAMVVGTILLGAIVSNESAKQALITGLGAVTGIILSYTLLATLAAFLGAFVMEGTPFLKQVVWFAGFSMGLVMGTMLIGALVMQGWDLLLYGIAGVTGVVLAYEGVLAITSRLGKNLVLGLDTLKTLGLFAAGCLGIAFATVLLGEAIERVGPAGMIAAVALMGTVIKGIDWVSQIVARIGERKTIEAALPALKTIGLFLAGAELLAGGIVGLAYAYRELGDTWAERAEYTTSAFALISSAILGAWGVSKELEKTRKTVDQGVIDIKSTLLLMAGAELLAGGIVGLAYAYRELGDTAEERLKFVSASFALVSAVVLGAWGVSKLVTSKRQEIDKGVIDIKSTLLLMAGAELLAGGIIGLANALKTTNSEYILGAFSLITLTVLGAAGVARLASSESNTIKKGATDLLLAEGILAASEIVLFGAIALGQYAKGKEADTLNALAMMGAIVLETGAVAAIASRFNDDLKKGALSLILAEGVVAGSAAVLYAVIKVAEEGQGKWQDVTSALTHMTVILAASGAMAVVASKIENDLKKGAIALALCEALALGSTLVLAAVVKVANYGKESLGDTWGKETLKALGDMALIIGGVGAMAFAAGALIVGPQALWFAAGSAGIAACESLAYAGAKMLTAMIETVDTAGDSEQLKEKSLAAFNAMEEIIKATGGLTAMSLRSAARIVAGSIAYKRIIGVISGLSDSVIKLVTISKILETSGTSSDRLQEDIQGLLSAISPDIFVSFFDDRSLVGSLIKVQAGYKSYQRIIKLASGAVDLYGKFLKYSKSKKIEPQELNDIATSIMTSITAFTEKLHDAEFIKADKRKAKQLSSALTSLIQPISDFAELISKYSGDGTKLKVITYDENGNAREGKTVDVISTATTLITAVTNFCKVLYSDSNKETWDKLSLGEGLEKGIGIFASIIEPVSKFAEVLTAFNAEGTDTLLIPSYDKDGNLLPESRKVNVIGVASTIAGAVTTFIRELYVAHKGEWTDILSSLNQIDPSIASSSEDVLKTGNQAGLREAIGIFGEILNPVLNFASVLLKFGTEKGMLTVIDDSGKARPVNVAMISSNIAGAVTEFITRLAGIFKDESNLNSIRTLNDNSLLILDVLNGFVDNVSNAASIDAKRLNLVTDAINPFVEIIKGAIFKLTTELTAEEIELFTNDLSTIQSSLRLFIADGITTSDANRFDTASTTFTDSLIRILSSIKPEQVAEFENIITGVRDFLKLSINELISITSTENINVDDLINGNTSLAEVIKNSYLDFFNTVTGTSNEELTAKVSAFRTALTSNMAELMTSFVSDAELAAFRDRMIVIKESLIASINEIVGQDILNAFDNNILSVKTNLSTSLNSLFSAEVLEQFAERMLAVRNSLTTSINDTININDVSTFTSNMENFKLTLSSSLQNVLTDAELNTFALRMTVIKESLTSSIKEVVNIEVPLTDIQSFANASTVIRNGLDTLLGINIPQENISRFEGMYTSLRTTITSLINDKEITNVEQFNKNFKTLADNLSSASQTSKVKQINILTDAVQKNVTEFRGFDDVLTNGNAKRVRELNEFGKAVENISNKMSSANSSIKNLKDLFAQIKNTSSEKLDELGNALEKGNKPSYNVGGYGGARIDYAQLADAIAYALSRVLDGTQIIPRGEEEIKTPNGQVLYKHPKYGIDVNVADETINESNWGTAPAPSGNTRGTGEMLWKP